MKRLKNISRKIKINIHPLRRRMIALQQLLNLERPTSKAKAYSEWSEPPEVIIEDDETQQYYSETTS